MEVWIDGELLERARDGDKESVRELCDLAGKHLRELAYRCQIGNNDLIQYVSELLSAIVDGQTPDEAFKWKRSKAGRPPKYGDLLEWTLACHVADLKLKYTLPTDKAMTDKAITDRAIMDKAITDRAIRVVGEAAYMDKEHSGNVAKFYYKWRNRVPEHIYPISKKTHDKIKEIDARIAIAIAQFKADNPQK